MILMTRTMRWPGFAVIRFALSRDLCGIGGVLMKKWFIFIMCLWASQASAQGTYTATNCSQAAVAAAIKSEQANPKDGDIISIPAGSCTWSSQLVQTFNNSVTIQGAGAISATTGGASTTGSDVTSITDNFGGFLVFTTTSGKSFRFTGIAVVGSVIASNGIINIAGTSSSVRVDHCHMVTPSTSTVGLYIGGSVLGVADHMYFDSGAGGFISLPIVMHNGNGWNGSSLSDFADHSWNDTDHWGSNQFFFFEDDRWSQGDIGDAHDGARYIIRHSTVTGSHGQMYNHGLTDARGRSTRAAEVYLNTFNRTVQDGAPSYSINSGTLLYWGNTSTDYRYMVQQDYTRKDNATYPYGTTPGGWGNCNGTTTSTAWDGTSPGYPCLDQPGRGKGDLLNGQNFPNALNTTTSTISFAHQALSPVYVWNNTFNDAGFSPEGYITASYATLFADNTDYYQQFDPTFGEPGSFNGTKGVGQGLLSARPSTCTAGPGGNTPGVGYWATDTNTLYVCNPTNTWTVYYTPFTYPHPLSLGTPPAPPTNLAATVQ
jgi:hypothetical protein